MKLLPGQTDEGVLASFGKETSAMLMHDYVSLARQFGYALAYGREPAAAIEEDYQQAAATPFEATPDTFSTVKVKYFTPNSTGLFAVVECVVHVAEKSAVLLELIVTGHEEEKNITIEDISSVAT